VRSRTEKPSSVPSKQLPQPLEAIWSRPGREIALTFFHQEASLDLTVEQLRHEVLSYSVFLKEAQVRTAQRVVLVFPAEQEQIVAFLACLHVGAVPCLIAPLNHSLAGALRALGDCIVLTTRDLACRLSTTARVLHKPPMDFAGRVEVVERSPNQDLYIQFSSGTSSVPKGARVSTFALQAQIGALRELCRFGRDEVSVSWLPLHHDLGLVLHLLTPLTQGFRAVLLQPMQWLRRPRTLFRALTTYRGTVCCMPPSAFEYALRHVEPGPEVDLDSWRIAGCAAEPISFDVLNRFAARFGSAGFRSDSLWPAYGMAENVAGVSARAGLTARYIDLAMSKVGARVKEGDHPVVSCGRPLRGVEVRVVGEDGEVFSEGVVGELEVRGESLFSGYSGAEQAVGWHSTGDLGFIAGDELYPLGRCNEVLNTAGHNIYPSELEDVAREALGRSAARLVAFGGLERGGERRPVLACEHRGRPDPMASKRLQEAFLNSGLPSTDVCFVPRGWVELTTSGKLARARCREKYLEEKRLEGPGLPSCEERRLAETVKSCLGLDRPPGPTANLLELGLSSLEISTLLITLQETHNLQVTLPRLVACPTIRDLAQLGPRSDFYRYAVCLRAGRRPVFVVPGMRQSALLMKRLLPAVSSDRACYGLQPPGLDGKEPAFDSVVRNAEAFLSEVRAVQPAGPYTLVGVCFGGWVAYEMARQLEEEEFEVERLVLIDVDPHHPPNRSRPSLSVRVANKVRNRFQRVRRRLRLAGQPHLAALERVYRAQMKAAYGYAPRPYSGGMDFLAGCAEQAHDSSKFVVFDWPKLVGDRLRFEVVENDGGSLLEEDNLPNLNEALRRVLA